MKISYIAIGAIASVLTINSVMAAGENTVASKSYVDARDDLKQNKIPQTGTNSSTPGDTVVTYTDTAGTIGERGIYAGASNYTSNDANSLVTTGVVHNFAAAVESLTINDQELTMVDRNLRPCNAGDTDCDLWTIGSNTQSIAAAGTFAPLTAAALKGYNESAKSPTECASGYLQSGENKCGCEDSVECSTLVASGVIAACAGEKQRRCDGGHVCGCK